MASGKKRSFDAAFKLSVIEDVESTTNRAAARKFKVDERRIREWRQKKSDPAPPSTSSRKLKKLVAAASDRGNTVYIIVRTSGFV